MITSLTAAKFLNKAHYGSDIEIKAICTMKNPVQNGICFAKQFDQNFVLTAQAYQLFVIADSTYAEKLPCSYIISDNPRLDFIKILQQFFEPETEYCIDDSAKVLCKTGKVAVGAFTYIGKDVVIGEGTIIGEHVTIKGHVEIGNNCIIKPGAVIGGSGFGFSYDENGIPIRFYHSGDVKIGNNVYIGSNTCIDRGTITSTIVEDHVKIDNLVHVAHNCHIKKNSFIIANTVLCGGTVIGEYCTVAPNAVIKEQTIIADNCLIGLGSVVLHHTEPNKIYVGNPAKAIKERQ